MSQDELVQVLGQKAILRTKDADVLRQQDGGEQDNREEPGLHIMQAYQSPGRGRNPPAAKMPYN